MNDLLYNLLHPLPNAVMTVIMGVLVIYWLFVMLSGAGLGDLDLGFDFDVDVDADVDIDADVDTDIDADAAESDVAAEKEPGFFMKFLNFMNVGRVPFMLVLSTLKFFMWAGSLITTQFINITEWGGWSLIILIPLFVIGVFFTKWATKPLVKIFHELGYKGEEEIDFLGRSGKMLSNIKDNKIGCAEVIVEKNPIRLNVQSIDGEEINYGDYIIVADETEDKKIFFVSKEVSIRNMG